MHQPWSVTVLQPHPLDLPPSMEQQQQQSSIQDETNPQDSFDNMYIPGTASLITEVDSKKEVNK